MHSIIFVGDYDYQAKNEGELSFRVGDTIRIYQSEGDWWYGEALKTGEVGWVAPTYGHTREESPYLNVNEEVKIKKRNELFQNIILVQSEFISVLFGFIESIIIPLALRDTPFKRSFLGEPSVAVSFSLLQEIFNACSNFDSVLRRAKTDTEVANAYVQFAPSLQLFAQYASENSKLLNSVKTHARQLSTFLSNGQSIEASLIMPLQHYTKYKVDFQEFVWLSFGDDRELEAVAGALDIIIAQTDYVDAKLKEEAQSLMLLNLQDQFSGNHVIFTPSRRIVKEGDIERVRQSKDGIIVSKTYFAHLFNDAFIYSTRNIVTGRYKLHNVIDLKAAVLEKSGLNGVVFGFSLCAKDNVDKIEHFRFANEDDFSVWFTLVNDQLNQLKAHKIGKRSSVITRSNASLPGVDVQKLGPRCTLIYRFLLSELQFADAMSLMNITVIQPLIDASKGAVLNASKVTSSNIINSGLDSNEGLQLREGQAKNRDALFEGTSASQSKYQTQIITDSLQDADVQIFLRAAEGIALSLRDFVNALEVLCTSNSWSESLSVGSFFNSVSALALYNQFKAYAAGQQATLRILKNQSFVPFYKDAEQYLSSSPGSFVDKIELPRKRVKHFLNFMQHLQKLTPQDHLDYNLVCSSIDALQFMERDIDELVRLKKNFEELLEIQSSLVSLKVIGNEPILQKLASMDRTIISQGDLKKVCRKKNKTFRFWLFNDYIIYGSSLGGGKFSFNRALEISKCSVSVHTSSSLKHAFEIFGAEKSFIVIAASQASQVEWVERITKAKLDYIISSGVVAAGVVDDHLVEEKIAPLWVPDNGSDACTVCKQDFTFWNRRHHCRKCGALVCNDHSKNKEILAHIHKTQKQKICDNCFLGKSIQPSSNMAGPYLPVKDIGDSQPVTANVPVDQVVSVVSLKQALPPKPLKSAKLINLPSNEGLKTLAAPPIPLLPSNDSDLLKVPSTLPPPIPKNRPLDMASSSVPPPPPPLVPRSATSHSSIVLPQPPVKGHQDNVNVTSKSRSRIAPPPPPAIQSLSIDSPLPSTQALNTDEILYPNPPPPPAPNLQLVNEDPLRKYKKMLEMLPQGAVLQKMASDGFSKEDIDSFMIEHGKFPELIKNDRPPAPSQLTVLSSVQLNSDDSDVWFKKYVKMKDILPSGAVKQKMMSDGFCSDDIDLFLLGTVTALPRPKIDSVVSLPLKSFDKSLPPPPKKVSLLDEIQGGSKLKSVQKDDTRMKSPAIQGVGGLLGMLANKMSERRFNMKVEDEDDDSDSSGFSDSDSDSEDD